MFPRAQLLFLLPFLFACTASPPAARGASQGERRWSAPERRIGQVNTQIGGLLFQTTEDWEPAEEQIIFGLEWAEPTDLPFLLEGGLHYSFEDVNYRDFFGERAEVRQSVWTFSAGLLFSPFDNDSLVRPYAGFGGTYGRVDFSADEPEGEPFEDRDSTVGGYAKVGMLLNLYPGGHTGIEYRMFWGREADLNGVEYDPSYQALMLVFGTSLGN